ncbi:hypothetical protein [Occallatibacter riparius]|uniref:Transmembrane protein n=1 Tax=Occallatibacter riparius TaxID=1002689 RepID=A0A9J7BJI4_9BACT|nr:hypothetical protein [Occallatibacter riparius]UWZ82984.1 hypothetical protein MOP44_20725 [Occallatibacter riparius]
MQWLGTLFLSAPLVCIVALVLLAFLQGLRLHFDPKARARKSVRRTGAAYALGATFLYFSMFYHPRLELAATAQTQQQEQQDEDDSGEPESPIRRFLRQLRSIRRGEPVDRLIWKLE